MKHEDPRNALMGDTSEQMSEHKPAMYLNVGSDSGLKLSCDEAPPTRQQGGLRQQLGTQWVAGDGGGGEEKVDFLDLIVCHSL